MASKKAVLVYILEILKDETDANHTLSQEEIRSILAERYEVSVDRKTLGRHLNDLYESGDFSIQCEESAVGADGTIRRTDFYMIHTFEDSELRLLIDGILASRHITASQRKDLIGRVAKLGSSYFKPHGIDIESNTEYLHRSQDLFLNIDLIEEAIQKGRKISLAYCQPDVDKRLHINLGPDHKERKYVFNPFQLVMNRGHYYLVGNHENYDDMSTLRVDRIAHITVLNERRKPLREIKGYQQQRTFNVSQYVKEHIYMFGGESITVTFKARRSIVNQILDWFDGNVEFTNITADNVVCRVRVNHDAFKYWALQYMQSVKVLSPASLVAEVKEAIEEGLHQYS